MYMYLQILNFFCLETSCAVNLYLTYHTIYGSVTSVFWPVIIILCFILYYAFHGLCTVLITSDSFMFRMFVVTLRDPNC